MTENLHLLTGAYVLHALDPVERADFEAHLVMCVDCQTEVGELAATVARLSDEVAAPPVSMRSAVLAQIATTPQESRDELSDRRGGRAPARHHTSRRTTRRTGWLAVAAAVVAVVALVLGGLLVQARSDRDELAARQQQLTGVLTASDAHTVTGTVSGGGRATVVVSDSRGKAAFVASGLAEPTSGHTYQLWYITSSGAATSAGIFDPDAQGDAAVLLDGSPGGATTVGLTVEPDGGSSQPTTKPVLAVPVGA